MKKNLFLFIIACLFIITPSFSQHRKDTCLKFFGSIRLRAEFDRDSENTDGSFLPDNNLLKLRFRFGVKYYKKNWEGGARIRTGNPIFPQSADIILGNTFNNKQLSLDKAYIKYSYENAYVWAGKNSINLWQPDQLLWDMDINPEGIGLGKKIYLDRAGQLQIISGYFIENQNKTGNNIDSQILFAQLNYQNRLFYNSGINIVPGFLHGTSIPTDETNLDYQIFFAYFRFITLKSRLKFHFDYFYNFKDYSLINPSFSHKNTGFALHGHFAVSKKIHTGITYAHIEKYAVAESLAQNDWSRYPNMDITKNGEVVYRYSQASNFKGWKFSVKYKIDRNIYTDIKFYKTQIIKTTTGDTALAGNNRLQWSFVYKF